MYAVQGRDTSVRDISSRECNIRERDESSNNKHIVREHSVTGVISIAAMTVRKFEIGLEDMD